MVTAAAVYRRTAPPRAGSRTFNRWQFRNRFAHTERVDLILVLPAGLDLRAELLPDAYNVVSKRRVRSRFGFDMFVVRAESVEYGKAVEFFTCVRGRPQQRKGMLRLQL